MVYSLETINGRNWFKLGADYLIASQMQNGAWKGKYSPQIDTCFGLMFLCRSNVVKDLTHVLRTKPKNPEVAKNPPGGANTAGPSAAPGPKAAPDTEAAEWKTSFLEAKGAKQAEMLTSIKQMKGAEYTYVLASVIPMLSGDTQKQARDILSERIARLKPDNIRSYMAESDAELRRAAAMAVYQREEDWKSMVPDVIALLNDNSDIVWRTARLVLKSLSGGKDFGPPPGATEEEKKMAIAAWTAWHKELK
jgi:hypothetical protein